MLLVLTAPSWLVHQTLGDGFLSSYNLFTLSQLASETLLIGFSQLVVVVIGRLNLAVGGVGVAAVTATGWLMTAVGHDPMFALPLGIAFGGLLGLVLGALEVLTGLGSFIVTLAMSSIYVGAVLILSGGAAISAIPASVADFSDDVLFTPALSWLAIPALAAAALLWFLYDRSAWGWLLSSLVVPILGGTANSRRSAWPSAWRATSTSSSSTNRPWASTCARRRTRMA